MSMRKTLLLCVVPWVAGVSLLHAWLNLDLFRRADASSTGQFKVGFLPVT